ncbi:hypothetical protein [Argonema antarcticum]|uniref:hypothetical protein n=1 Tax=Argonema antarcticum TaxID=2942763 RepID=UPI0020119A49|nr:hypothetical protein [Argonema antarcticum]MCL1470114.1 hypothetical protein [Argonema antarcticum A004/B2]
MGDLGDRLAKMSPERRHYALETLPSHLAEASQSERFYKLLTDFDFIEAKISALGVQSLVEDYDFAFNPDVLFSEEKAESLRLIKGRFGYRRTFWRRIKHNWLGNCWGA